MYQQIIKQQQHIWSKHQEWKQAQFGKFSKNKLLQKLEPYEWNAMDSKVYNTVHGTVII